MIYQTIAESDRHLVFATHPRARRGRGVLFALAPLVGYVLIVTALFIAAVSREQMWRLWLMISAWGVVAAAVLSPLAFAAGYRAQTRVEATAQTLEIQTTCLSGRRFTRRLECPSLSRLEIALRLRSLGADLSLLAIDRAGHRIPLADGEPHSGQLRELGERLARITNLPLVSSTGQEQNGAC